MAEKELLARVLIDSALPQLDHLFDYRVPEHLVETARPGVRVTVPLRNSIAQGYLVELGDREHFAGPLAPLDSVVSELPVLDPDVATLARRVADRQAGSASDVLRLAIPKRQVRVEKAELAARAAERELGAAAAGVSGGGATVGGATGREGGMTSPRGAPPRASGITGYPAALTELLAQGGRLALAAIPRLAEPAPGVWVGGWAVTLAEAALLTAGRGRSAIIGVPDYRDLDQLQSALAALSPDTRIARLDAKQSGPERYRAFLDVLAGRARVIIGNRSALYAPAQDLGLIALWDDGDPLHAEQLAPYAHARDVALVRQELSGAAIMLAGHTRSLEAQRLVELGWLQAVSPHPPVRPKVILVPDDEAAVGSARRIPSSVWQSATVALETGPVLVQVARPAEGEGAAPERAAPDVLRTAHELGRAFAQVKVIAAHGADPVRQVPASPALVVATRGAEPMAPGGYRAVLLLDARRMLARESLGVTEDCLRWWSNAAALAAPGAPVHLVGVVGGLGERFATWRHDAFAAAELADRRSLRFPPASRIAVIEGEASEVKRAIEQLVAEFSAEPHWPAPLSPGVVRGAVRFDYRYGGDVARTLREAVLRNASGRRAGARRGPVLRVRMDDKDFFNR